MSSLHKAGFVSITGNPNVGKSTLMNQLVGENLSIITSKAQTTRHRIMGILSGEHFQIVYSDTPGWMKPRYALHKAMLNSIRASLEDADLVLLVVEPGKQQDQELMPHIDRLTSPIILVINKIDLIKKKQLEEEIEYWKKNLNPDLIIPVSALKNQNIDLLLPALVDRLPYHPAYYPKDELTDRSQRFFAAEIIREKIFLYYNREIPYSVEVVVEEFGEENALIRIRALLFVERTSQKGILIGKEGSALKKTGTAARQDLEKFFGKKIFLETHVKVAENWRKETKSLKRFGYTN